MGGEKMNSMIYNPQEEFDTKFKSIHLDNTQKYFQKLVDSSGIDISANRKTVKEYNDLKNNLSQIKRRLNLWRFLRVLMIITLILIPFVLCKINPKIKALKNDVQQVDKNIKDLLELAYIQVSPLNSLFSDCDALKIIELTIPMISFAPYFSAQQEANMNINYDFRINS